MRKKILILTPFYPPNIGGAETFTEMLAKEASTLHDVQVLTFMPLQGEAGEVEVKKYDNKFVGINRIHWLWKPPKVWQGVGIKNFMLVVPKMYKVARWYHKIVNYDIIHAQGLLSAFVAVLIKRKHPNLKVFCTLLALYDFAKKPRWFKAFARWIFNRCDMIFVEGLGGWMDLRDSGYSYGLYKIFQHWADDRFKPIDKTNKQPVILFVGRNIKIKGRHLVDGVQKRFIGNSIGAKFLYADNVPYDELHNWYQTADILVVPSLYSEGFVRVIAEAASCRCAIVANDVGSLKEMIRRYGFLARVDTDDLYTYLRDLCLIPDMLTKYKKQALDYAQKHYTKKNAGVFLNEY